jgi:galactoside O-acetyltransferase
MAFYTNLELQKLGFKYLGNNVLVSKNASIYGFEFISIGSNSRIDDFVIISANTEGIDIGEYVHIAPYCSLIGSANIKLCDFSGISSRVSIYSSSDDYSGNFLTNPCVAMELRNVISKPVILGYHVIVGVNSVIMPGVSIGNGSAVGAFSFVTKSLSENIIANGIPARKIGERSSEIFTLEKCIINKTFS